jgi:hypothetical protein
MDFKMKKIIFIISLLFGTFSFTQGNLQFNRVVTFTPGSNYTVPVGKVLKIESINMNSTTLCLPKTGEENRTSSKYVCIAGIYNGINYLTIGNQVFSTPTMYGTSSGVQYSDGSCNFFNGSCWSYDFGSKIFNYPIWLEEGKTVLINSAVTSILISAIEFNIIP